jgi:hypothetical protein
VDIRRGGPADDDVFLALEHESGVRSHLWASSVAGAPGPRLRVLGSLAPVLRAGRPGAQREGADARRPAGRDFGARDPGGSRPDLTAERARYFGRRGWVVRVRAKSRSISSTSSR